MYNIPAALHSYPVSRTAIAIFFYFRSNQITGGKTHLLFMLCSFKFNSTVQYRSFRRKYATAYMTRMSYPKFRFFVLCVSCISTGREIFASIRFGKVIVLIVFACMHKHLPVCPAAQVCWQLYVFY